MISFRKYYILLENDYRGEHTAPLNTPDNAPLFAMDKIYPDDIYSSNAARYYGDMGGDSNDNLSVGIIQSFRNRPNAKVRIYRAVPKVLRASEKLTKLETMKYNYQRRHTIPSSYTGDKKEFFDWVTGEIEKLQDVPDEAKMIISPGDWVTINKQYAIDHGNSALNGEYRILTKTVLARQLFTDANSIHEFGYDPS